MWADWEVFARRPTFIQWAEPPPADASEERYAVVSDSGIRWARVSPNPAVSPQVSPGCFYDDMPGGAIASACAAARKHKAKIRTLTESEP